MCVCVSLSSSQSADVSASSSGKQSGTTQERFEAPPVPHVTTNRIVRAAEWDTPPEALCGRLMENVFVFFFSLSFILLVAENHQGCVPNDTLEKKKKKSHLLLSFLE